jgi:hypothetical protein
VRVAWATASELRSAYFAVERSALGGPFAEIGRVAAQGTTAASHSYTLLDQAPLPGLSYYRLRQVDVDGTTAYSPVVAVRWGDEAAAPALECYPNPASAQGFRLRALGLAAEGATVRILDPLGRLVLAQAVAAGAGEAFIKPAQSLPAGLYFVTWHAASGTQLTTKVVIE